MSPQSPVVLVVEDDPAVADAFATYLRSEYSVRTADSGEAAMDRLDADVDVVLLDRRMPDAVGDEVARRIRAEGYDVRVAMVTAVEPDFDVVDVPFDDYLVKPVERETLLATVERLLRCAEYDRVVQEYYGVVRTQAALRASKSPDELANDAEYAELVERRERLREKLRTTADSLDPAAFSLLFGDLGADDGNEDVSVDEFGDATR